MVKVCWRQGYLYALVEVEHFHEGAWLCHATRLFDYRYYEASCVLDVPVVQNSPCFNWLNERGLLKKYENMTVDEFLGLVKFSRERPECVDFWY